MGRESIDNIIDFDSRTLRQQVMSIVGRLSGLYEVKLKPRRATRTTRANAFYFAAIVTPFFELLREQDPAITDKGQAHIEIKRQVLGTREVRVGDITLEIVPTTHDMDGPTFWIFVEGAMQFMREKVGIDPLNPREYGIDPEEQKQANPKTERQATQC
jgi:hypothetical protein